MLRREPSSPNNSQSRRGLIQTLAGAEILRAVGWAITGAGALVMLLAWVSLSPVIAAVLLLAGGLCLFAFNFRSKKDLSTQQAAFRVMPAHLAALDAQGNVILVNDAWHEYALRNGFQGESHGKGFNYIDLCESATGACAEEARVVATGIRDVLAGRQESFSIEYPCHSPTEEFWFRCVVSRFPGEEQGALVTHLDITEQVKMWAQVKELKDRQQKVSRREIADLKAALDEHAIVAVCDRDGIILSANDRYCETSKYTRGELIGTNAQLDAIPERAIALSRGETWKGEALRKTRNGEPYWVTETVVPFHDEATGTSQFVIIGTDITGRKHTETSLLEELARSNAALSEFAYLASHDLQEPLRGVNGCVQLLADRYGSILDADGREWIRHAVLNTERMQSLISGLLDLSRIERHPAILSTPVDAQGLVDAAVGALKQAITESKAEVQVIGSLPLLQGDGRQIGQVFQNLLANAIKFHSAEVPRIQIRSKPAAAGFEEFSVKDNGIGIDPLHAERIFGIFQRLHASGRFPGAGIGLALAKRIVERHGGQIWVEENQPGESGAEFRFTLPLHPSAKKEIAAMQTKGAR